MYVPGPSGEVGESQVRLLRRGDGHWWRVGDRGWGARVAPGPPGSEGGQGVDGKGMTPRGL